jgi:hypothetical protein
MADQMPGRAEAFESLRGVEPLAADHGIHAAATAV